MKESLALDVLEEFLPEMLSGADVFSFLYMFLFCAELKMDGTIIWDFVVLHVPMKWEAHVEHVQFRGQWLGRTKAKTRWLQAFKMLR